MLWIDELKNIIKGEVAADEETLKRHSRDASIFELMPKAVVFPKDVEDVKALVHFVSENKEKYPELSLTARSAGTGMEGGALNESIIVDFTRYFNKILAIVGSSGSPRSRGDSSGSDPLGRGQTPLSSAGYATVQPGVYYRDLEKETLKRRLQFPSYPASKSIAAIGGIVSNNAGGEKSLKYGQTNKNIKGLRVVLQDGNEYEFYKLNKSKLQQKKTQDDFEGRIYRRVYELIEDNYEIIQKAKPTVSKNSAGYYLWNVWDREYFDLTQLFTGSQGTLGIITEAELELVKKEQYSRLIVVFLKSSQLFADFVNAILPHKPESLETFDDNTLKLAIKFLPDIAKKLGGRNFISLAWSFLGDAWMVLRYGFPKFVVLAQFTGNDDAQLEEQALKAHRDLLKFKVPSRIIKNEQEAEKYWVIRRESFNLLRKNVKDKKATPFIDDIIVAPPKLPEFLPKLYKILKEYEIPITIAAHAGSGNLHIIPLMDLRQQSEREKIPVVADKVYNLVLEYGGSITAEHNDGLMRSPYLEKMYGAEVYGLFKKVKEIFDPKNIFNPGKKVNANLNYAMEHIKKD